MRLSPEKHLSDFIKKLRRYTALATAVVGLIYAMNQVYLNVSQSQILQDIAELFEHCSDGEAVFNLEVGGKPYAKDPSDDVIKYAVRNLGGHNVDAPFLSLDRSANEFIQAITGPDGWTLGYRAPYMERPGGSPVLFNCQNSVGATTVIKAMTLYRHNDSSWTNLCAWDRVRF
jgi:hypothetical protein